MIDLQKLTIVSAREALKKGDFTARELTQACLDAIKHKDPEVHAFLEVFDDCLEQAEKANINLPLGGIPIALKDNMLVKGKIASAGSKILENYRATYDSTVVKKLKEAGAVIIGRTNCDEFAMGSSTENSAYGPTKNPIDPERVPGGSSGGSAAAVAAGMVLAAFGSDTGGSIRQPAAFTGIVGMKPTYGRVSRSGLIAMASSLDQIGPFAKTVEDAEMLYEVVKGQDPLDSTTLSDSSLANSSDVSFGKHGQNLLGKNGFTIGVPRDFFEGQLDKDVAENFEEAVKKFESLGYKIKNISLPLLKYSLAVYYILMPAEVSSNLARFDGVKYGLHVDGENSIDDYFKTRGAGFGREARRRIILGTYVLSSGYYDAYYGQAVNMKRAITEELRDAFKEVDLILTPSTPTPAFKFGEKSDPLSMYLADIFTVPGNISGCPSASVPSGFSGLPAQAGNLPLGLLLTADLGNEAAIFEAGKDFQK
ncbi:Asp-tRNA(Asn)/Glu-tRNA(Gln) amidotransferase subunit GatA [Candidatus Parcubacteria bacterium]|nr:Asp-tRNA(Asn)/Glu-tRNA(Gln) amidotransferase subunit GatA [Candidatus Parcubacteria bacterium]